jgi:hypothetical protein
MEVFWNLLRVRRTEVNINQSRMNDFILMGCIDFSLMRKPTPPDLMVSQLL